MSNLVKTIFTTGVINSARKAIASVDSWVWDLASTFGITLISNWDDSQGFVVRKKSAGGQSTWMINLQCLGQKTSQMVNISHAKVLDYGNKTNTYADVVSSGSQNRIKAVINFLACLKKIGQLPKVGTDMRTVATNYGLTVDTVSTANKAFVQFLNGTAKSEVTLKKYIKASLGKPRPVVVPPEKAEPTPTEKVVNLGKECEAIGGNNKSIKAQEATTQKTIADLGDDELRNLHASMLPTWVAIKKEMIKREMIAA
tara:strand:- start:534 stop:1301 length:768 start_codon:yes stop_codon:yes gene_type:complete